MNVTDLYLVNESSSEYPIQTLARWIRSHDLKSFHFLKTVEVCPRTIVLHYNNIRLATPKEVELWMKHHPGAQ